MKEWWRGAIIYQIYPRSFNDANGDGIGDLTGITQKLDYISELGVDGIWISPFFRSPMKDFGYDVSDYCDIDPIFGTLEDFDILLEEAHRRDLKVLIDMVLSHTSDQHSWFQTSSQSKINPYADWYVWADPQPDGGPPNNWLSVFGGGAWAWEPKRCQYYLHNFLREQPDLNFHNPEVQDAVLNACRFWLERGVDGFRLDVCNYYFHDQELRDNPPLERARAHITGNPYNMQRHVYDRTRPENMAFLGRLRTLTDSFGETLLVGEISDDDPVGTMGKYTEGKALLHTAYSFGLLQPKMNAELVRDTVETFYKDAPNGWPSWSFSNHDVIRIATRWGGEEIPAKLSPALNAVLLSLPGTIFLYQGEELGLPESDLPFEDLRDPVGLTLYPDNKGRDGCRTPMPWVKDKKNAAFSDSDPWLPVGDKHFELAVDQQVKSPGSTLMQTQALISFWREHRDLRDRDFRFLPCPEGTIALARHHSDKAIILVANLTGDVQIFSFNFGCTLAREEITQGLSLTDDGEGCLVKCDPYSYGMLETNQFK